MHVVTLARLSLTKEESETFVNQLSGILDYINQLEELDTDNIEPTSHALDLNNVFREDQSDRLFDPSSWRKNAPSEEMDHFKVPRIIEE